MKKLLHNIYNFFYVAFNWNLPLAIFVTWHEIKRGPKYNINTIMRRSLANLTIVEGDKTKSSPYEALNYFVLENLLANFRNLFPEEKSLIDVGAGKGRVMVVAAHYGFTKITGVDFAKELCAAAKENISKIEPKFPDTTFTVHCRDILSYPINAGDKVFFLFNPFNEEVLAKFLMNVEDSLLKFPRPVYFIYANPKHGELLLEKKFEIVYRIKKLRLLEGIIAVRR